MLSWEKIKGRPIWTMFYNHPQFPCVFTIKIPFIISIYLIMKVSITGRRKGTQHGKWISKISKARAYVQIKKQGIFSFSTIGLFLKIYFYLFILFYFLAAPGLSCSTQDLLVTACRLLSCGIQDLAPRPGIEPRPPALGVQSLTHWTAREVPTIGLLIQMKIKSKFSSSKSNWKLYYY